MPSTKICPITKGVSFQVYFPEFIREHWIVRLNDVLFVYHSVIITIYCKSVIISIMIFVAGQLKMLQENLRILQNITYHEAINVHVQNCIKEHQEIIGLVRENLLQLLLK